MGEVSVKGAQSNVEAAPTGTYDVKIDYTVTFTNTTDADGSGSDIVLRPQVPAGFTLKNVTGTGTPWWVGPDSYAIQDDGSLSLRTGDSLNAHSSTTMTSPAPTRSTPRRSPRRPGSPWAPATPRTLQGADMQIDVAGSEGGTEAGTHTICTPVTHTGN